MVASLMLVTHREFCNPNYTIQGCPTMDLLEKIAHRVCVRDDFK
jgi:hypothetical protein